MIIWIISVPALVYASTTSLTLVSFLYVFQWDSIFISYVQLCGSIAISAFCKYCVLWMCLVHNGVCISQIVRICFVHICAFFLSFEVPDNVQYHEIEYSWWYAVFLSNISFWPVFFSVKKLLIFIWTVSLLYSYIPNECSISAVYSAWTYRC